MYKFKFIYCFIINNKSIIKIHGFQIYQSKRNLIDFNLEGSFFVIVIVFFNNKNLVEVQQK